MPNNQQNKEGSVWYALSLAWQLGYTIAVPIVVLALVGRLLDKKFGTTPWLLLAGILVSLIISSWAISRKVVLVMRGEQGIKNQESGIKHKDNKNASDKTPNS